MPQASSTNLQQPQTKSSIALVTGGSRGLGRNVIGSVVKEGIQEFRSHGITVNVVSPGGIEIDFGNSALRDPEMKKMVTSITALGRVGQPESIGGAVAALLSPEMGWVNGQRIEVSGGQNL